MFLIDRILLVGAILMLLGTLSSKFSTRMGLPVLVLFLVLGMVAGSEGLGGIAFDDPVIAHGVGTAALAAILFDGGLQTRMRAIRAVWKPAILLATVGVLVTSVVTGVAAARIMDLPLLEGLLLGSIVGSTDAAAVFALLRNAGVHLKERLAATLEVESGSNDPMAIFLTVGLLEVLVNDMEMGLPMLQFFVFQMGIGSVVGIVVGLVAVRVVNWINLATAGLYPVLTGAFGLLAFGIAAVLGGSGFLAIYIAGIVLGNSRLVFQRGSFLFHDGLAWVGQITMFVVLGLLSFPSRLIDVAPQALLVSAVLILIARPVAVIPLIVPFRYSVAEIALVSWVGLKGAVPIILAIFPLIYGLPSGGLLFDVVFFVVLVSAVAQGWTLPFVARKLGLQEDREDEVPVSLEITSLRHVDADIVEYTVGEASRAAGKRLDQLAMPDGVVVAMIARRGTLIPPRGSSRVLSGDHVFVVLRQEVRPLVNRLFSRDQEEDEEIAARVEFPLLASARVEDLVEFYGIVLDAPPDWTLDRLIREHGGEDQVVEGERFVIAGVALRVLEMVDGRIERVGLEIDSEEG